MADFQYRQPQRFRTTNRQREEMKQQKSKSSGGIPDRWLDYLGVHKWVENTRFVAFKCPLRPDMQKHLPEDRRFTLGDLVEKLDNQGKELGLIIDLTNTDRYYKPSDIEDAKIQYFKLMTPGHNRIPNEACYQQFMNQVKTFLEANKKNDKLIGVHCTHGLNRTGYLVVRFMIEEMDIDPHEALEAFNRSRGHSMEKYTDDLLQRKRLSELLSSNDTARNSISTIEEVKPDDNTHSEWPSLYSTMEAMTLSEGRKQKNQQSRFQITPRSIQGDLDEPQSTRRSIDTANHDNYQEYSTMIHQRRSTSRQENEEVYHQYNSTRRFSKETINNERPSMKTSSTYFGSGSNVGRGRPLTNER